jgi:hypothetical protein
MAMSKAKPHMVSYFLSILKSLKDKKPMVLSVSPRKTVAPYFLVMSEYETYLSLVDKKKSLILKDLPYLLVFLTNKDVCRIYFLNSNLRDDGIDSSYYIKISSIETDEEDDCDKKLFYYVGNFQNDIPRLLNVFNKYLEKTEENLEKKILFYSYRMNGYPERCLEPTPYVETFEWL